MVLFYNFSLYPPAPCYVWYMKALNKYLLNEYYNKLLYFNGEKSHMRFKVNWIKILGVLNSGLSSLLCEKATSYCKKTRLT